MYNFNSIDSIVNHAKQIKGLSLNEYRGKYVNDKVSESSETYNTNAFNTGEGSLGQLVEEVVFDYRINSIKDADFSEVGMELKVAPVKEIKQQLRSKLQMKS